MIQMQQGDVLIFSATIPTDAKARTSRVVAEGEVTGHMHAIEGDVEMYERDGVLYCRVVGESATITHQEHNPITLPKGDFQFGIVQEFDYDREESRNVAD